MRPNGVSNAAHEIVTRSLVFMQLLGQFSAWANLLGEVFRTVNITSKCKIKGENENMYAVFMCSH